MNGYLLVRCHLKNFAVLYFADVCTVQSVRKESQELLEKERVKEVRKLAKLLFKAKKTKKSWQYVILYFANST